jgi:neutral ceramidase
LKRELSGSAGAVWVAAYSNDVLGYVPTERVLREGGYEGLSASRLGSLHPSPWAPGLEEQIVTEVHELIPIAIDI